MSDYLAMTAAERNEAMLARIAADRHTSETMKQGTIAKPPPKQYHYDAKGALVAVVDVPDNPAGST